MTMRRINCNLSSRSKEDEEIRSTIHAMCYQEATGYMKGDYIHGHRSTSSSSMQQQQQSSSSSSSDVAGVASNINSNNMPLHHHHHHPRGRHPSDVADALSRASRRVVDVDSRAKMIEWCYQVIDFCHFSRETVEIAVSCLDRFMMTSAYDAMTTTTTMPGVAGAAGKNDGDRDHHHHLLSAFQLVSMTCLYTAVKVHEAEAMAPNLIVTLSRGMYTARQIEDTELSILTALRWRVNPPTSWSFVRLFADALPPGTLSGGRRRRRDVVHDLATRQCDAAVRDYRFVTVRPSVIAYCAFMNAMEEVLHVEDDDGPSSSSSSRVVDEKVLGYVGYVLSRPIGIDCNDAAIVQVQNYMYERTLQRERQQRAAASSFGFPPSPCTNRAAAATTTTTTTASCDDGGRHAGKRPSQPSNHRGTAIETSPRAVAVAASGSGGTLT